MDLPIAQYKEELLHAIHEYQALVVVGDTGSGKTTQLPKYIVESSKWKVAVTQPRRVACISAASRVAEEMGARVGDQVGYSIRFEKCMSESAQLVYMTDATLLRYAQANFDEFDIVVLDEAHERSLETDILLGLLRKAFRQRENLKVIIMSATLDMDKFSDFFDSCPIFSIPGRLYEVDIFWQKEMPFSLLKNSYVQRAIDTAIYIHKNEGDGDILVFLTGKLEIDRAIRDLRDLNKTLDYTSLSNGVKGLEAYPIYSSLETIDQKAIFVPTTKSIRKIIVATNIAQTSVTVPGIRYVVDCGFVKQKQYDPKTGINALLVVPISQAAATQRAGRAGRTESGKVYRLYSRQAFEEMSEVTVPEIKRSSLVATILYLLRVGVQDVLNFDFLDPPEPEAIVSALKHLFLLSAIDEHGHLTHTGKIMAEMPISPYSARALISSAQDFGCSEEVAIIVALLSVEEFIVVPRSEKRQQMAAKSLEIYLDSSGDHITFLNIYQGWKASGYSKDFCAENFLHFRALTSAKNVLEQLISVMRHHKLQFVSCAKKSYTKLPSSCRIPVLSALCAGYYLHTAKRQRNRSVFILYVGSIRESDTSKTIGMHLSQQSALAKTNPDKCDWVMFNDVQYTNKAHMRVVSRIDFGMVKVLFGRVDLIDVAKLCKMQTNSIPALEWEESEPQHRLPQRDFDQTHEVIMPKEHKELSLDGTVMSKSTEVPGQVPLDLKRREARDRYLARKKLKQ
jgi:HrpA-like RNA helicase